MDQFKNNAKNYSAANDQKILSIVKKQGTMLGFVEAAAALKRTERAVAQRFYILKKKATTIPTVKPIATTIVKKEVMEHVEPITPAPVEKIKKAVKPAFVASTAPTGIVNVFSFTLNGYDFTVDAAGLTISKDKTRIQLGF